MPINETLARKRVYFISCAHGRSVYDTVEFSLVNSVNFSGRTFKTRFFRPCPDISFRFPAKIRRSPDCIHSVNFIPFEASQQREWPFLALAFELQSLNV